MQPLQFQPLIYEDSNSTYNNLCLSTRTYRTVFFVVHCMQKRSVFFDHIYVVSKRVVYVQERVVYVQERVEHENSQLLFCFLQSASRGIQLQILCTPAVDLPYWVPSNNEFCSSKVRQYVVLSRKHRRNAPARREIISILCLASKKRDMSVL